MPLIKAFEEKDNEPALKIWRYWCACLYPTHVLELVEHGEDMEFSICIEPQRGLWCRIKTAWDILRGNKHQFTDIIIDKDARDELASVLKGEVVS